FPVYSIYNHQYLKGCRRSGSTGATEKYICFRIQRGKGELMAPGLGSVSASSAGIQASWFMRDRWSRRPQPWFADMDHDRNKILVASN
ncbi:hypothetical protein AMECASPLE_018154, partial [Ameca splendens]